MEKTNPNKIIILLLIILIMLNVGICVFIFINNSREKNYVEFDMQFKVKPSKISQISIVRSGGMGPMLEISDRKTIDKIIDNLNSIKFLKGESSEGALGLPYSVILYKDDGTICDGFVIRFENMISYRDYFYNAVSSSIDVDYIEQLFEERADELIT